MLRCLGCSLPALALLLAPLLPAPALCSAVVQYSSAADTSLEMRVVVGGSCRDVYATPRLYAEAQFMFREVAAIDGSGGVSLVPAANDDSFVCDDGTGSGRLVVTSSPRSPSLCSFKKVAGLSNPSLVSFEQGGRYIGYAKAYDYDCAVWFDGKPGWTVGLVPRPSTPALATWVASDVGPVQLYVQHADDWLAGCRGSATFAAQSGDTAWDVVPALASNSSPTAVSLRLHSNASLFLVADAQQSGSTARAAVLGSCGGREGDCTWSLAPAQGETSGVLVLRLAGSNWTLGRLGPNSTSPCASAGSRPRAALVLAGPRATLGLWRASHTIPNTPDVVASQSAAAGRCADLKLCRSCVSTSLSCGWCADTGVCSEGSTTRHGNCSASGWLFDTCAAAARDGGESSASLVAPLVGGIVGGVAVLSAVVVAAVLVARGRRQRRPSVLNLPMEGAPVAFEAARSIDLAEESAHNTAARALGSGGSGVDVNGALQAAAVATVFEAHLSVDSPSPGSTSVGSFQSLSMCASMPH
eukprot:m51a1_g6556 hypothetical protein (527) ;mRNA; r:106273-108061